jgi:hypothetical protein
MGYGQDDTSVDGSGFSSADSAGRFRARLLILLAITVIAVTAFQGWSIWPKLPDRIPIHFGIGGAPDGWSGKGWFSVFGMLGVAGFILGLLGVASSRLSPPSLYNFPGKPLMMRLPREQQEHVLAPMREGLAWMAAGCATGLALMAKQTWQVALGERAGMPVWVFAVPFGVGLAAVLIGVAFSNRRARELTESAGRQGETTDEHR